VKPRSWNSTLPQRTSGLKRSSLERRTGLTPRQLTGEESCRKAARLLEAGRTPPERRPPKRPPESFPRAVCRLVDRRETRLYGIRCCIHCGTSHGLHRHHRRIKGGGGDPRLYRTTPEQARAGTGYPGEGAPPVPAAPTTTPPESTEET
jgi:hypothetical protein